MGTSLLATARILGGSMTVTLEIEAYERMRSLWVTGGRVGPLAPPSWQKAVEASEEKEQELRLLVLAEQFRALMVQAVPPEALDKSEAFPLPSRAILSRRAQRLFRKIAAAGKAAQTACLVKLLHARGYMLSPSDIPHLACLSDREAISAAHDLYQPWLRWLMSHGHKVPTCLYSATNFEDWVQQEALTERCENLVQLFHRQPEQARDILKAALEAGSGKERWTLLNSVRQSLDHRDIPLLEQYAKGRKSNLKELAGWLRTQKKQTAETTAKDYRDLFLSCLVQKKRGIVIGRKTSYQIDVAKFLGLFLEFEPLCAMNAIPDLAQALDLDPVRFLTGLSLAPIEAEGGIREDFLYGFYRFLCSVQETETAQSFAKAMVAAGDWTYVAHCSALADRLDRDQRRQRLQEILAAKRPGPIAAFAWAGPLVGAMAQEEVLTPSLLRLMGDKKPTNPLSDVEWTCLLCLMSPAAAQSLAQNFPKGGSDQIEDLRPLLQDILTFNALLLPSGGVEGEERVP